MTESRTSPEVEINAICYEGGGIYDEYPSYSPEARSRTRELLALLPRPDVPALRKAVEWVETQATLPGNGEWDQVSYVRPLLMDEAELRGCGTAYCLAGYVAAQTYPELMHTESTEINGEYLSSRIASDALLGLTKAHHSASIVLLGRHLYSYDNTPEQIRQIAELMAGEQL